MNRDKKEEKEDVILLRPYGKKYYRVRITANPADPRTIAVTEDLLSKCEISRCESSNDDGVSVWSLIIEEGLVDDALRGIAVVVATEYEFFQDNESRIFLVTQREIHALGGYAEETALCWEENDLEDFEAFVNQIIADQMSIEIQGLLGSLDEGEADKLPEVQDRAWALADVYQWGDEDVREGVQDAYRELLEEEGTEEGER